MRPAKCAAWAPLAASLLLASGAQASEANWGLKSTALVGTPIADAGDRSSRLTLEPSLKWQAQGIELRARERLRRIAGAGAHRGDADLRELTAAWRGDDITVTLGAQQLNWGRMDILRVTDVINPVDTYDLFYEELPEAKLALWMANFEWQGEGQTLQFIVSPQVPVDRLPAQVMGLPVRTDRPSASLNNATLAVRYGVEAAGWNADFLALHGWLSAPTLQPVIESTGPKLLGRLSRQTGVGFSADKPLGPAVIRLEALYARITPEVDAMGTTPGARTQASFGLGVDVRHGPWFFAAQAIAAHDRGTTTGSGNNAFLSLIVQRKWLQDRLAGRAMHIRDSRNGSSWSSLQLAYELTANQLLQLQCDRFDGAPSTPFGAFADRSRVAASVRLQF